jgi:hypothetical protein
MQTGHFEKEKASERSDIWQVIVQHTELVQLGGGQLFWLVGNISF